MAFSGGIGWHFVFWVVWYCMAFRVLGCVVLYGISGGFTVLYLGGIVWHK